MFTKNYKNILICLAAIGTSNTSPLLPITATDGKVCYLGPSVNSYFPGSSVITFTAAANGSGISVGTGDDGESESDYNLVSTITSGLSASLVRHSELDENGNPQAVIDITFTNISSSEITIREIGLKQNVNAASSQTATWFTQKIALINRTVLNTPVTIPSGEYAVIRYTLKGIVGE